jgi:hypothetical protein
MTTTKVIGITWPKSSNATLQKYPVIEDVELSTVKGTIERMLFTDHMNQCLLKYNNVLYICEPMTDKNYSRTIIQYHPYMTLLE